MIIDAMGTQTAIAHQIHERQGHYVLCVEDNHPKLLESILLAHLGILDTFLLYCALEGSPSLSAAECGECTTNVALTVKEGSRPGLQLSRLGQLVELKDWGLQLLERIEA